MPQESGAPTGADQLAEQGQGALPHRRVTMNMLVSYNIAYFRKAAGLTQKQLGAALGWSEASASIAERGWDGRRVRKFDADELTRVAGVLGIPVIGLLLPPEDAGTAVDYLLDVGADRLVTLDGMLSRVLPEYQGGTPASDAFVGRVIQLGADWFIRQGEELVLEARRGLEESLLEAPGRSEPVELLLEPLVQAREDLQRRIGDLRAFERDYRSRLLVFIEEQARQLRAGAENPAAFRAVSSAAADDRSGDGDRP